MQDVYKPCPCGSGKKFKFCCNQKIIATDPVAILKQSPEFPVYECLNMEGWEEGGLAPILIVRQQPNLKYTFGVYLVDYYCLGLKNTMCNVNMSYEKILHYKNRVPYSFVEFDYQDARSMILGGIEYARELGFSPNPDWRDSQYIVEADKPFEHKFTFGKDGKPLFVNGPEDNVQAIMAKLHGKNFDYMIGSEPV
jgi:hypothetical protein